MHISMFAGELRCRHCGQMHATDEWPERGDGVAFYYQDEPGRYSLTVSCPYCGKDWYIVWDDDPGPIMPLSPF